MDDSKIVELYLCRNETAIQGTSANLGKSLRALAYALSVTGRLPKNVKTIRI